MNALCGNFARLGVVAKFSASQTRSMARVTPSGRLILTKTTGHSRNTHRSNRAKEGLYHGADVQFGHTISHSVKHSKRRWNPNVQSKRVFSFALDGMVRFKMTTKAMKAIDDAGGIDRYLLQLDEKLVTDSPYITKIRSLIANKLYFAGELEEKYIRKMKYHLQPPKPLEISFNEKDKKWYGVEMEKEEKEGVE